MKKSVAMKWVKALRSGKYKQAQGALKVNDRFCCLGVLCDISKISEFVTYYSGSLPTYLETEKELAGAVMNWAEIKSRDGDVLNTSLTYLNDQGMPGDDVAPLNFDEIADIIQINWKEL